MKKTQILPAILTLVATSMFGAEGPALPARLKSLTENYEAAVTRATAPLTKTYLTELSKLKLEYTRAGDLQSALLVENVITKYTPKAPPSANTAEQPLPHTLTRMNLDQFKSWLATVQLVQPDGGMIEYDGTTVFVTDSITSRRLPYSTATVDIGKITIPFSKTSYSVEIDNRLRSATINTNTGAQFEATIRPTKDK